MRWPELVAAWCARLEADAELTALIGPERIYPDDDNRAVEIPSVTYTAPIFDQDGELFNRFGLQVDLYVHDADEAAQVERRIRLLTHADATQVLAGERVWIRCVDSQKGTYGPETGVVHRVIDFEVEAVREQYQHL